ncbi:recombinase family protein [Nonomuraea sp. NPDC050540]|uniref:recombinase family protein n=1 Tax=Nonomuraea sp. NPDC050540 TaxID=3364367 RepID=UPI003795CC70
MVTQIFAWRIGERLSYTHIADRLNLSLERCPPPVPPDPARALGRWSGSAVRDILTNPKYTGYMVWNRRSTKTASGKVDPPEQWVWSDQQSHEPLVTREVFITAQRIAKSRERSRSEAGPSAHVQTKRSYALRSFIFCSLCDRRMFGKTRRETAYYTCLPARGYRPEGHPPTVYVREDRLMEGITEFFARNVFGPARKARLSSALIQASEREVDAHAQGCRALQRLIEDLDARRARLITTLEITDDPTGDLARDIQERMAALASQKADKVAQLRDLERKPPVRQAPDLLDALPTGVPSLDGLPEELLRRLFDVFRLRVRYDRATHIATCTVTLTGDAIDVARATSEGALEKPNGLVAAPVCMVPPVGFEPTHPAPEATP